MGGYQSPDEAAMVGFPEKYCRVVGVRVNGDDAYVLLNTGSATHPYLYGVHCKRDGEQWYEGSSGNGGGWSLTDEDAGLETLSLWDHVSPDADLVRIEYGGRVSEHPIVDGIYLAVWWRQPPDVDPRVIAIRLRGEWS